MSINQSEVHIQTSEKQKSKRVAFELRERRREKLRKGRREERERGGGVEGGIQLLSAPGRLLLSRFGYRNHKEPRAALLALYSVFSKLVGSCREEPKPAGQRVSWSGPPAAQTSTQSTSVALWHASGITAAGLSGRRRRRRRRVCIWYSLSCPLFLPEGGSEGRESAELETRQRGESVRKSGTAVQVRPLQECVFRCTGFSFFCSISPSVV